MQVTETSSEGLKRKLKVVVGAGELGERLSNRLDAIKDRVELKGFRRGKVPVAHIRKVYGRSLMSEVVEEAIRETSSKAIADRNERAAAMPAISITEGAPAIETVISGNADLSYEMSFEVLPEIKIADLGAITLERWVVEADESMIAKALDDIAGRNTRYEPEEGRKADTGDEVTIDYAGFIDGKPFEGSTGERLALVIGNANFIPGFEDGLKGATAGDSRTINARFPDAYPVAELAGKDAVFEVSVKAVAKPAKPAIDDEFGKSLGLEGLDKLRELVSGQIGRDLEGAARVKLKRELLDELDKAHLGLELPPSLIEREFDAIWRQLMQGLERQGKTLADEEKPEEELRTEYRTIAERRVRLGLVFGEIGDKSKIEVSQDEMRRALIEQARRFPGQEKAVYEYFEKTPGALQELRAPIFEDKVVDHVLGQVKTSDRKVSREELDKALAVVTGAEALSD